MVWLICVIAYFLIGLISARVIHLHTIIHPSEMWKMIFAWPLILFMLIMAGLFIASMAVFYSTPINFVEHGFSFKKWTWRQIE